MSTAGATNTFRTISPLMVMPRILAARAATAGMHLGLQHDRAPRSGGDRARLLGRRGDVAGGHGNAVAREDVAGLILVQVHASSLVIVVPAAPCRALAPWASAAMIARRPPVRTKLAAASTLGRMLPVPSSFPASRWSAWARLSRRIGS